MTPKTAILCDDDKTTTMILKHLLTPLGFSVSVAQNGKEGMALIEAAKPDLLILDLEMPVKNGISVLQDLKEKNISGFYTIVLSSHESETAHDQVKQLGADEVVVKPFTPALLVKHIEDIAKEGRV